jgi:hypothetical protein
MADLRLEARVGLASYGKIRADDYAKKALRRGSFAQFMSTEQST